MKFIKLALLTIFLALFALACNNATNTNGTSGANTAPAAATPAARTSSAPSPTPAADQFAHASTVYAQNCAICHGDEGKGGTVDIEGKKLKVPSLVAGHALKGTDEHYFKQISNGEEAMPAFKDKLKPEEINELVRFIRQKLQAGGAGSAPPAPKS